MINFINFNISNGNNSGLIINKGTGAIDHLSSSNLLKNGNSITTSDDAVTFINNSAHVNEPVTNNHFNNANDTR